MLMQGNLQKFCTFGLLEREVFWPKLLNSPLV